MWYLVRRHLNYSREEWERLPWVDQLVYLEGLVGEFYEDDGDEYVDDSDDLSDVTAMGANVQRIEAS